MSIREILELVISLFVAAFGYFKWWYEIRQKHRERKEKEKAQKELADIQRRAQAPFLRPSDATFNHLYHDDGNAKLYAISCGDKTILCAMHTEVEATVQDGEDVFFVVENIGQAAHACSMRLDGESISLRKEADMQYSHGHQYITYPYCKSKRGQQQKITLSFESTGGVQDTHIYMTRHGMRILQRIDPPLP